MTIMRQITNSIKCLIVFGIWLLGFNTLSACNIKLKIVYAQADLRTIFDITPELFDKGLISHSLDSIIVVSDMKFSKFFATMVGNRESDLRGAQWIGCLLYTSPSPRDS